MTYGKPFLESASEIEKFLSDLIEKILIRKKGKTYCRIKFKQGRNRIQNREIIKKLGITSKQREECIQGLNITDYSHSILRKDDLPLRVFGVTIKHTEVYVKIDINRKNKPAICISFHEAEQLLSYPYKS